MQHWLRTRRRWRSKKENINKTALHSSLSRERRRKSGSESHWENRSYKFQKKSPSQTLSLILTHEDTKGRTFVELQEYNWTVSTALASPSPPPQRKWPKEELVAFNSGALTESYKYYLWICGDTIIYIFFLSWLDKNWGLVMRICTQHSYFVYAS